ncbi:DUF2490 domain-containing protein [Croceiramulus getboli]|nr:DUF2490 domain-containing protein [Flavobacteriaceae bacterium YJPT1-3]
MGFRCATFFFCSLLFAGCVWAQTTVNTGLLPALNINKKLAQGWAINFKVESRFNNGEARFSKVRVTDFTYDKTDVSAILSKQLDINHKVAAGYLARLEGNQYIHRFIQQYTLIQRSGGFRLAHRIASDQTLEEGEAVAVRLRYRLSSDFALRGREVDPGEVYLKINNEYLIEQQSSSTDFELRLVPVLGYYLNDKNKVELGPDYRIGALFKEETRQRLWLSLTYYWVL